MFNDRTHWIMCSAALSNFPFVYHSASKALDRLSILIYSNREGITDESKCYPTYLLNSSVLTEDISMNYNILNQIKAQPFNQIILPPHSPIYFFSSSSSRFSKSLFLFYFYSVPTPYLLASPSFLSNSMTTFYLFITLYLSK
jgi:hypothetical protein